MKLSEFIKVQKRYGHWRIMGYRSTEKVYDAVLQGNLTDDEISIIV